MMGVRLPGVVGPPSASVHLSKGINAIADLLAPTLGPAQWSVAYQRSTNEVPEMLDDSGSIVRRVIALEDAEADVGAMILRNLVWRVVQQVGDGGATTAVLMRAIYNDGLRLLTAGADFRQLKQGIELASKAAVTALYAQAQPVTTEDQLAGLALTVVSEPDLAALLGEISAILGPDAQVMIEDYVAPVLDRTYIEGARFPSSVVSRLLYLDPAAKRSVVDDTRIALLDGDLDGQEQILGLLDAALQAEATALTIITPHVDENMIGLLVANQEKLKGKLAIVVASLKMTDAQRLVALQDLALLTGATLIGQNYGLLPAQVTPRHLGYARRVDATVNTLTVVTSSHARPQVQARVTAIHNRLASLPQDAEERPALMQRLSTLTGGLCRLRIGDIGQTARGLRHSRAERALKVLSAAQRRGAVAGGGAALHHSRCALDSLHAQDDVAVGVQVLHRALSAPLLQLLRNGRVDAAGVIAQSLDRAGDRAAYDLQSGQIVDAFESGLLDVPEITARALATAASGALMALSTDFIVYHKNPQMSIQP